MARQLSSVLDISNKDMKGWTVLVQVVERGNVNLSRGNPPKKFRRFLLTDSQVYISLIYCFVNALSLFNASIEDSLFKLSSKQRTKVSAVVYDSCIRLFFNMLWPYKRYYVSNASLSNAAQIYRVSQYQYSWIINSGTLVEPHVEPVSPPLPCTFQLTNFSDLHRFVDIENLQNVKAIVQHGFAQKSQGPETVTRDFVIVNEEYNINKDELKAILEAKTYRDPSMLLPPPNQQDIVDIHSALASFKIKKTAWVHGQAKLTRGNLRYWFTACSNCHKAVHAEIDWSILCPSCQESTTVEIRENQFMYKLKNR